MYRKRRRHNHRRKRIPIHRYQRRILIPIFGGDFLGGFLKGKDIAGKLITCNISSRCLGKDIVIMFGGEEYRFTALGVFISGLDLAFLHKLFMIGNSVVFMGFIFTIRMKVLTDLQLYLEVKRRKRISFIGIILCLPLLLLVSSE